MSRYVCAKCANDTCKMYIGGENFDSIRPVCYHRFVELGIENTHVLCRICDTFIKFSTDRVKYGHKLERCTQRAEFCARHWTCYYCVHISTNYTPYVDFKTPDDEEIDPVKRRRPNNSDDEEIDPITEALVRGFFR